MTNRQAISGKAIRNFLIELVIYGISMVIYFLAVLRLLGPALNDLFTNHLIIYAILALVLILGQGVVLELITSFIMNQLKLGGGSGTEG